MSLLTTASLVVTPNAGEEGTLFSIVPDTGLGDLSVTRATTATRVNSAGLVELVPYNLMLSSEDFTTNWVASGCSVTANTTTAPNGTTTADTVTDNSTFGYVYLTSASVNTSQVVTHSVFLKRTNNDWINVSIARGGATTYGEFGVWFNLATGAIGSNFQAGAGVLLDSEITDEGNGWYRCSITGYVTNAVSYVPYVFNSNADNSFTSSSGKSRYQWGAQLVEGSVAKDYQKTETRLNIPRLDYSNGTCPSILVEPQRTNSFTWSEKLLIGYAFAYTSGTFTVTENTTETLDPFGNNNADKFTTAASSINHNDSYNTSNGSGNMTLSIFAKKGIGNAINLYEYNVLSGVGFSTTFDIENGTIISSGGSLVSNSIEDYGNGWYRCSITGPDTSAAGNIHRVTTFEGQTYLFGWQLELNASYPTSYIPTTSASVTRNADVISKTGISSLIGQTEGTLFVEFYNYANNSTIQGTPLAISNGGFYGNAVYFEQYLGSWYCAIWNGTSQQFLGNAGVLSEGYHKLAVAYKANDIAYYVDGNQIAVDTSATIPTCDRVDIGAIGTSTNPEQLGVKAAALWKTRLTNTQLAQLTTI